MDVAELAVVGAKIVEVGTKLKTLRKKRDDVVQEISELEQEILPLVAQHAKIIAEVVGMPSAPVAPQLPVHSAYPTHPTTDVPSDIKERVIRFLEQSEEPLSALNVAEALKLSPVAVRQVMADLARQGR